MLAGSGAAGALAEAWIARGSELLAVNRGPSLLAVGSTLAFGGGDGGVSGGGVGSGLSAGGGSVRALSSSTGAMTGLDFTVVVRRLPRPVLSGCDPVPLLAGGRLEREEEGAMARCVAGEGKTGMGRESGWWRWRFSHRVPRNR